MTDNRATGCGRAVEVGAAGFRAGFRAAGGLTDRSGGGIIQKRGLW